MRRTWNTLVSPTIGIATIGTGKIGLGAACAAAGAVSARPAAVIAAAAVSTLRRVVFVMASLPDFVVSFLNASHRAKWRAGQWPALYVLSRDAIEERANFLRACVRVSRGDVVGIAR